MHLYFALATLLSLTVAVFAIQNSELVTIRFLFWQLPSVPQVIVILGAALGGMVIAFFFGFSRSYQMSKQLHELKDYARLLEQELIKYKPKSDGKDNQQP
ncbi:MAG: LapA family protein [Bacillota bacterium]